MKRRLNLDKITSETYDIAIIGGGITGAGILHEAGKMGYNCILIDKNDFSSGTSSKSAKLIHGGLRYLQYGQFGLVREALKERQYLLEHFPHIVKPLPFIFPIYDLKFKYRIGMVLYQFLSSDKTLSRYTFLSREKTIRRFPAINQKGLKGSFIYYDAITNDSRLCNEVIQTALESYDVIALNYCELISIDEQESHILLHCKDHIEGKSLYIKSKFIINASGPWMDEVLNRITSNPLKITAPSKGIHIVLSSKHFPLDYAIVFSSKAEDKGMLYALPWENNTVIIGPTDTEYQGDLNNISVDDDDISYILNAIHHFAPSLNINKSHIISAFAGIRPLIRASGTSKERSRDYRIWWAGKRILNIFGGKLTSFRSMAKSLLKELQKQAPPRFQPKAGKTQCPKNHPHLKKMSGQVRRVSLQLGEGQGGAAVDYIKSKYGNQSNKIFDIFSENPANKNYLHKDFKIHLGEIIYFIRYQSCYHLDDLLARRTSLSYVLPACKDAGLIIKKAADIMKKECQWTEVEYQKEINTFTDLIKQEFI